jgi:tyrosine-protein phosphatase YwqE
VNDSEGIAVEWDTYEEAKYIADLFQTNSVHGYTYIVIHPNGKLDV